MKSIFCRGCYLIFSLFFSLAISACSTIEQIETREQWISGTTRVFYDRNSEQIIGAAEAVVKSINPRTTEFVHKNDGFYAKRPFAEYYIVAASGGFIEFDVKVEKVNEKSHLTILIYKNDSAIMATGAMPSSKNIIKSKISYDILFDWIDFSLGKSEKWKFCDHYKSEYSGPGDWNAPGVCFQNSIGGILPVEPKPEWLTKAR
jgi:hypothetical protein